MLVERFLENAIASTPIMTQVVIRGNVFGKESCRTPASAMRAILPLPAFTQVLDVTLPTQVEDLLAAAAPCGEGSFIGSRPRTQCLDVAHSLQFVIEKGLDDFGK